MIYKNCSGATRTFYGVTFGPGEIHAVPGAINAPRFVQLHEFPETAIDTKAEVKPEVQTEIQTEIHVEYAQPEIETVKETRGRKSNKIKEAITNGSDSD